VRRHNSQALRIGPRLPPKVPTATIRVSVRRHSEKEVIYMAKKKTAQKKKGGKKKRA